MNMHIKRIVLEFEERVVVWDGEDAEKMMKIIEETATRLDFEALKAEPAKVEPVWPVPTAIYDARDKTDYPK